MLIRFLMPIYEYVCDACGHGFERFQSIKEGPIHSCPECEDGAVRRVISKTSFQLKGSGWYATDYSPARKERPAHDGKSSGKAGSKPNVPASAAS